MKEVQEIENTKPSFKDKLKCLWSKQWFKLLTFLLITFNIIFFSHIIIFGYPGFDFGDGTTQYRVYIEEFIRKLKQGELSSFNINNFFGTSNYALTYYVPIDVFTLLMLLLSYVIPDFNYVYTIVKLLSVCSGVMMFYFMQRKVFKFSDKTSFYTSLLWLIGGALSIYTLFYTYLLMYFYIPLTLYVLDLSHKKKIHWPLLVTTILLMFYNFYQGYMIVACTVVAYFIIDVYRNTPTKENVKNYLLSELKAYLIDGIFVVLGVLASSAVVVPTIIYLKRDSTTEGREFTFSLTMLAELFIRSLTPQRECPVYYISSKYIELQRSLYLGIFGYLSLVNFVFLNKKDLKKNLITLSILLVMIIIPIFSYIFCAQRINYGRWYFLIELVLIYMISLNIETNSIDFSYLNSRKRMFLCLIPYGILLIFAIILGCMDKFAVEESEITLIYLILCEMGLIFLYLRFPKLRKKTFIIEMLACAIYPFSRTSFANNDYVLEENALKQDITTFETKTNDNSMHKTYFYKYGSSAFTNINNTTSYLINDSKSFSSFYNTNVNEYLTHYETKYKNYVDWCIVSNTESNPIASTFFGNKYFMIEKNEQYKVYVPNDYILMYEDENFYYYKNPSETGFASIYYNTHNNFSDNVLENVYTLNNSCYYSNSTNAIEYSNDNNIYTLTYSNNDYTIDDYGDYKENEETIESIKLSDSYFKEGYSYFTNYPIFTINENGERTYYLGNIMPYTPDIKEVHAVVGEAVAESKSFKLTIHSIKDTEPKEEFEQVDTTHSKDTFNITYNKEKEEECIIALPIAYTKDFKSNYEVVSVNGGFVGVIIPANETGEINVEIKFEATGEKTGRMLSIIFGTISLAYVSYAITKQIKNKKKESE